MTTIPPFAPSTVRDSTKSFTRTDAGISLSSFATDFTRNLRNGGSIAGAGNIVQNADGSVKASVTRTGPNGQTKEVTKEYSAEQVAEWKSRLNALGGQLAANPVTLPSGYLADGRHLVSIKA